MPQDTQSSRVALIRNRLGHHPSTCRVALRVRAEQEENRSRALVAGPRSMLAPACPMLPEPAGPRARLARRPRCAARELYALLIRRLRSKSAPLNALSTPNARAVAASVFGVAPTGRVARRRSARVAGAAAGATPVAVEWVQEGWSAAAEDRARAAAAPAAAARAAAAPAAAARAAAAPAAELRPMRARRRACPRERHAPSRGVAAGG